MVIRWEDEAGKHLSRLRRTELAREAVECETDFVMTGDTLIYVMYDETGEQTVYDCKVRRVGTVYNDLMDVEAPHA